MHIGTNGRLLDTPVIRAGFVGCGSHAFRNVYPALQFAHVDLVATCDLDLARAQTFARRFGAAAAYGDYRKMIAEEQLDAVFVVTGYDAHGRPQYPRIACDALAAGCHVWIEKPPAATCAEIEAMQQASRDSGRIVLCGMKKMFFPANEKAKELIGLAAFGAPQLATVQYPQAIPTQANLRAYLDRCEDAPGVRGFLDHLCHPVSLILFLFGMPQSLYYQRTEHGSGVALFRYHGGPLVTLHFTAGQAHEGGMERTFVVGTGGHHVVIDNNVRVAYHRNPPRPGGQGYGSTPSHFTGAPGETTAVWEPEFSLGQLYNKGLFLLGYAGEVEEFAQAILQGRAPAKGTLEQAWQATRIFEAFAEGPGREIPL